MTQSLKVENVDLSAAKNLAQLLSVFLRPRDAIFLEGALGAGKTEFARFLIRSLLPAEDVTEIPSPTFAIVQSYEGVRMGIMHFDLYRLSGPEEVQELGFYEDSDSLKLVEWAERLEGDVPADRLVILLQDNGVDGVDCGDDERCLTFTGYGVWAERLARLRTVRDFLQTSGWGDAEVSYLQGDASARSYARLHDVERRAILMNSPASPDGPIIKNGKSYSEIAHLAEDVSAFVAVANALEAAGLQVPVVRAQDLDAGLLIIDDLGHRVFGAEVSQGEPLLAMWRAGVDVLLKLRQSPPSPCLAVDENISHDLPCYDRSALQIEIDLLPDWYWSWAKGEEISSDVRERFNAGWEPIIETLGRHNDAWVLRDFHSPNLMLLGKGQLGDDADTVSRVGVIDFQDAVRGHSAYDLVSLLQDARLDVPQDVEAELLDYYCRKVSSGDTHFDEAGFRLRYAMFGAQRNTKILGIFARLAKRDHKPHYLAHLPRIWRYLARDLAHPGLSDMRAWYETHFGPELRGELA